MDQELLKQFAGSFLRHGLTTVAGGLVTHGLLQKGQTEAFIGAGMLLAGIAWSWWQKYGQAIAVAELAKLRGGAK